MVMGANHTNTPARDILAKRIADYLSVQVVEAGGGLVEEQYLGMFNERTGDRGALLLTSRQRCRATIGKIFQTEKTEPSLRSCEAFLG